MAIRKLRTAARNGEEARIRRVIADEMRRDEESDAPPGAPVIYMEESGTPDNYTHWYAVWDGFAAIDPEARTRVILDAINDVLGPKEALRVVTASGLTPMEARGMGFDACIDEHSQPALP